MRSMAAVPGARVPARRVAALARLAPRATSQPRRAHLCRPRCLCTSTCRPFGTPPKSRCLRGHRRRRWAAGCCCSPQTACRQQGGSTRGPGAAAVGRVGSCRAAQRRTLQPAGLHAPPPQLGSCGAGQRGAARSRRARGGCGAHRMCGLPAAAISVLSAVISSLFTCGRRQARPRSRVVSVRKPGWAKHRRQAPATGRLCCPHLAVRILQRAVADARGRLPKPAGRTGGGAAAAGGGSDRVGSSRGRRRKSGVRPAAAAAAAARAEWRAGLPQSQQAAKASSARLAPPPRGPPGAPPRPEGDPD